MKKTHSQASGRRNFLKKTILAATATSTAIETLAASKPTFAAPKLFAAYPGPLTDDAILAQAKQDIRKHRMGEVNIQLTDRSGKPLSNIDVELVQLKHSFLFGDCNVHIDRLYRENKFDTTEGQNAKKVFSNIFNAINNTCYWTERPRHDMNKTEDNQGDIRLDSFAACVDWANANGIVAKGHPIFWGVDKAIPQWMLRYDYATQMRFLEVRVRNLAARFKGKVKIWDAVNEALWEPALKNLSQRHWPHLETIPNLVENIAPIIRWAREEDPDAQFLLNDYGICDDVQKNLKAKDGTLVDAKMQRKRYLELAKSLQDQGAAPSGLGMQCHSGEWQKPMQQMAFYDEMATSGLPLHVTEFWASTDHLRNSGTRLVPNNGDFSTEEIKKKKQGKTYTEAEIKQMQADFVSNYLTCAFAHPAIETFFFWGFLGAAITSRGHSGYDLNPVYNNVHDLIHKQWHTHEKLRTNADGQLQARGFYGDYALRYPVRNSNQMASATFTIAKEQTGLIRLTANLA